MTKEVRITEIAEFEPERVDGVGKGANGFPILMLKSTSADVRDEHATLDDVAKDSPSCKTCDGSGKIRGGNVKCPDCFGSGKAPKVGESAKQFVERVSKLSAASSANNPYPAGECPTCEGHGAIADGTVDGKPCPDCGGTGQNQNMVNEVELNVVNGDPGRMSVGDPHHRERIDKGGGAACAACKCMNKANATECYKCGASMAKSMTCECGTECKPGDDCCPGCGTKITKAAVTVSGGVATGSNPAIGDGDDDDAPSSSPAPGSREWEAADAQIATDAAQALLQAAEHIRTFAEREAQEVAAGEGNDIYDAKAAEVALASVAEALGVVSQLAFHENLEATKALENPQVVQVLKAARDHLMIVAGGSPKPSVNNVSLDEALLTKELEDMTIEELQKVLDTRDERLVAILADTIKGVPLENNKRSIASAKNANNKSKKKNPKDEMHDLEDEAVQGTHESASGVNQAVGVAKGDDVMCRACKCMNKANATECYKCGGMMKSEEILTDEQIEAQRAAKEAKKALKAARKAEKEAAENAAVQKAIAEGVAEATEAVRALQDRLSTVEKMAAPSSIVRTRPQEALTKSVERDALEIRLANLERIARETPDQDIRKASREEATEVRTQIASLSAN